MSIELLTAALFLTILGLRLIFWGKRKPDLWKKRMKK